MHGLRAPFRIAHSLRHPPSRDARSSRLIRWAEKWSEGKRGPRRHPTHPEKGGGRGENFATRSPRGRGGGRHSRRRGARSCFAGRATLKLSVIEPGLTASKKDTTILTRADASGSRGRRQAPPGRKCTVEKAVPTDDSREKLTSDLENHSLLNKGSGPLTRFPTRKPAFLGLLAYKK